MTLLQLLFTYNPIMNQIFGSEPIGTAEWSLVLGTGLLIYTVIGIEKWLTRHPLRHPSDVASQSHIAGAR